MKMVQISLLFTTAQRDGFWQLHLHAFKLMLSFFFRHIHINYAKWGTMYFNEMKHLPDEVI